MRIATPLLVLSCAALALAACAGCRSSEGANKPDGARKSAQVPAPAAAVRGDAQERLVAGGFHTCAVLDTGAVKCWGLNRIGQLGLMDSLDRGIDAQQMGDALPPVELGQGRTAVQVTAGAYHTCALLDTGAVKCWGDNGKGQLGLGDAEGRGDGPQQMGDSLPTVDLGVGRKAVQVAAGDSHTCALLDTGAVKCWGNNEYGQLGLGDTNHRGDEPQEMGDGLPTADLGKGRTAVRVATGRYSSCAILDTGAMKCWGANHHGQLGLGDMNSRGDGPNEMGDNLPTVDLGPGRTAAQLDLGTDHTCAVLDTGVVKCWGYNKDGLLGLGDTRKRGVAPKEMGDALPPIDLGLGRTVVHLSAGESGACAILDTRVVKCWGSNERGRLGLGDTNHRGDKPNEMGDSLPAVDLGKGRTAVQLAVSYAHTCALLDNGAVKCWGRNSFGVLGLGGQTQHGAGPGEMGDALPTVDLGKGRTVLRPR